MKRNCVFAVEANDKREEHLIRQLTQSGYISVGLGQEVHFKNLRKVYLFSLSTELCYDRIQTLDNGSVLFSRNIDAKPAVLLKEKQILRFEYMDDEEYVFKNAHLTAEGALQNIMQNTCRSLADAKVLICGGGRIAKCLLHFLKKFNAYTDIAADDEFQRAYASAYADNTFELKKIAGNADFYNVIVNTVPKIILKGDLLGRINKNCYILDLASKPGGTDFAKANALELNCAHLLGVPGKCAPETAAKYLKDSILKRLNSIYDDK